MLESANPTPSRRMSSDPYPLPTPQVRELIQEVDGDGMTFLMHAASGSRKGHTDERDRAVITPVSYTHLTLPTKA